MLVAVVNPHEENTMKWAESNGCKGSFAEICKSEGLKEHILKELQSVAAKNKVHPLCNSTVEKTEHITCLIILSLKVS
jgi:long-subunit acyl-CoA synthetase (AMP-forming)